MEALIIIPSIIIGFISDIASEAKPITVVKIAKNDGFALSLNVR